MSKTFKDSRKDRNRHADNAKKRTVMSREDKRRKKYRDQFDDEPSLADYKYEVELEAEAYGNMTGT